MSRVSLLFISLLLLGGCSLFGGVEQTKWLKHAEYDVDDYTYVQSAVNAFGYDYVERTYGEANENLFMSPASMFVILAALYHGAEAETKEGIGEVIYAEDLSSDELMQGGAALLNQMYRQMDDIELNLASAFWLTDQYDFNEAYMDDVKHYFATNVKRADLKSEKTMHEINKWVNDATKGTIENIIDEPLGDKAGAALLNAIYFNGKWDSPFNKEYTEEDDFLAADGSVEQVPFMYKDDSFRYSESDTYQAIRIPYKAGEMAMYVYLPREDWTLADWLADVGADGLTAIQEEMESGDGELFLPKMKLMFEMVWNEYLQAYGMERAFDEVEAQFGNMSEDAPYIWLSDVKQKSFIEVDEEGTEASTVSFGKMEMDMALPPDDNPFFMKVDRPFLFTITDEKTNVDLFISAISNPNDGLLED